MSKSKPTPEGEPGGVPWRAQCCWCDLRATHALVHRDGWRDLACAEHAADYAGNSDVLEAVPADADARGGGR
jgi:hypothetical protein